MKEQFTKGPWEVNEFKGLIYRMASPQIPIASISSGTVEGEYTRDNIKANGHLMKATPDMYEVIVSFPGWSCGEGVANEWLNKREAALAKARGENGQN